MRGVTDDNFPCVDDDGRCSYVQLVTRQHALHCTHTHRKLPRPILKRVHTCTIRCQNLEISMRYKTPPPPPHYISDNNDVIIQGLGLHGVIFLKPNLGNKPMTQLREKLQTASRELVFSSEF